MAIIQTVEDTLNRLGSYNRHFNYNKSNWKYLLVSYLGGEDYRRAGLLTRYQLETDSEYQARLNSTPLENHVKGIIGVYISFLFRTGPERLFGTMEGMPEVEDFCYDADLEGRSLDSFMKDVATWSSVFGHCWILLTKPNLGAVTRAEELDLGVRPYANLLTPLNVLDWQYYREPSGRYCLSHLKYVEEVNGNVQTIKEWYEDRIETWVVDFVDRKVHSHEIETNGLGKIPAVCVYNARSGVRGLGISDVSDISNLQQFIYNMTSEVEQTQRMDAHPSLVKTPETSAGTGAGSIISMPENLDPGLKPYLLEYTGASVDSLYKSIEHATSAIDKLASVGSVRGTVAKTMSGIAMETEFNILASKLSEKADNLELAEEQLWTLFAEYMGMKFDGEIDYPDDYSIHDEEVEYNKLKSAKASASGPEALAVIDQMLINLITDDTELEGKVVGPIDASGNIMDPAMDGATIGSDYLEENPSQMPGANPARPVAPPSNRVYFSTTGTYQ